MDQYQENQAFIYYGILQVLVPKISSPSPSDGLLLIIMKNRLIMKRDKVYLNDFINQSCSVFKLFQQFILQKHMHYKRIRSRQVQYFMQLIEPKNLLLNEVL
ncbi:hypothetical protein pb186bvf_003870 [Paramecium bursaria]